MPEATQLQSGRLGMHAWAVCPLPSTGGELCVGLCVSGLGSPPQEALGPELTSDRTWVSARTKAG